MGDLFVAGALGGLSAWIGAAFVRWASPDRVVRPSSTATVRATAPDEIEVPLRWSDRDHGLVIDVRVGSGATHLVLDSASHYLALATEECARAGDCEARDAGYRRGPAARNLQMKRTLRYATLTIEADVIEDDVELVGGRPPVRMAVFAARSMEGTSSNVLGVMNFSARKSSEASPPYALAQIMRHYGFDGEHMRWSLVLFHDLSGVMVLGRPQRPSTHAIAAPWTPFSRTLRHLGAYIVDLESVLVGPSEAELAPLPAPAPKFLVIDTGTAATYVTSNVSAGLVAAGFRRGNRSWPWMEIRILGGARIVMPPESHEPAHPFEADVNLIDETFGADASVMLLGATHMRGMRWDFDLARQSMRVSAL